MSNNEKKGVVGQAVEGIKKAFKWNVEETGDQGGIKFLNRGGFMRERQDNIERMGPDSYVKQDSLYTRTTLPWLNIGEDPENFEKNDAFLDALDYYKDLCIHINNIRRRQIIELNQRIMTENLQRRLKGEAEIPLYTLKEFEDVPVDLELESYRDRIGDWLTWMAKINLGLSFENPDDNKALVLNKQVIVEPNPQTSQIYKMIRDAMGPDVLSPRPEKIEG